MCYPGIISTYRSLSKLNACLPEKPGLRTTFNARVKRHRDDINEKNDYQSAPKTNPTKSIRNDGDKKRVSKLNSRYRIYLGCFNPIFQVQNEWRPCRTNL